MGKGIACTVFGSISNCVSRSRTTPVTVTAPTLHYITLKLRSDNTPVHTKGVVRINYINELSWITTLQRVERLGINPILTHLSRVV